MKPLQAFFIGSIAVSVIFVLAMILVAIGQGAQ